MKFYVHVPKPDGRWSNDYREATSDEVIHEAIRLRPTFTANHRPQVSASLVDDEMLKAYSAICVMADLLVRLTDGETVKGMTPEQFAPIVKARIRATLETIQEWTAEGALGGGSA